MNSEKAIILAGGLGSRLSEETHMKPKPMVEIGGKPILWHIMKNYYSQGVREFIICLGYKGYVIKEYFSNYFLHNSDVTIDFEDNSQTIHKQNSEKWKVTLVDTGEHAMTGARLKKVLPFVKNDPFFHFTYGDGLASISIEKLRQFHLSTGKLATLTSVAAPGRFGSLDIDPKNSIVKNFKEKPKDESPAINGGFFVLSPQVIDFIDDGDDCIWERTPLEKLTKAEQLGAYRHNGFWKPMDTLRDKKELEKLWQNGDAPWKSW